MTPDTEMVHIALSLVSHTNTGKTTLARTLLGRDIGEVRDAAHVTELAEGHVLIDSPEGDRLSLWDTPGFGDSHRLARRLGQSGNPIGWMLTQVWDRFRDRPLWSSQQAIRNVRERADLVLYLVNAAEDPADAGYLDPELQVLDWIGKPVIVLLNQTGAPRPAEQEAAERARWRTRLQTSPQVRAVLGLDAFARCWVQEIALLDAVAKALPPAQKSGFSRLHAAWRARREAVFGASMQELGRRLARAALDAEPLPSPRLRDTLRALSGALRGARDDDRIDPARRAAMRALAERLDADVRQSTDRLIAVHELEGHASQEVLERLAAHFTMAEPLDEGRAAVLGGLLAGSLAGLKADLATGGLTLGGGLLAGGLIGALSAAGLARGYNLVRGADTATIRWSAEILDQLVLAALLGYLAVAHYGRGRGEWSASEHPPHWEDVLRTAIEPRRAQLQTLWSARSAATDPEALAVSLARELDGIARHALSLLYPETPLAEVR